MIISFLSSQNFSAKFILMARLIRNSMYFFVISHFWNPGSTSGEGESGRMTSYFVSKVMSWFGWRARYRCIWIGLHKASNNTEIRQYRIFVVCKSHWFIFCGFIILYCHPQSARVLYGCRNRTIESALFKIGNRTLLIAQQIKVKLSLSRPFVRGQARCKHASCGRLTQRQTASSSNQGYYYHSKAIVFKKISARFYKCQLLPYFKTRYKQPEIHRDF